MDNDTVETNSYEKSKGDASYIGKVINNIDPLGLGRCLVQCGSLTTTWVDPKSPLGGGPGAGAFFTPIIGANVKVTFMGGNIQYGTYECYSNEIDLAVIPPTSRPFVKPGEGQIRMATGTKIKFNEIPPGITIETIDGNKIEVDNMGIRVGIGVPDVPGSIIAGIEINKTGQITLRSTLPVSIDASQVSIKAANISLN